MHTPCPVVELCRVESPSHLYSIRDYMHNMFFDDFLAHCIVLEESTITPEWLENLLLYTCIGVGSHETTCNKKFIDVTSSAVMIAIY